MMVQSDTTLDTPDAGTAASSQLDAEQATPFSSREDVGPVASSGTDVQQAKPALQPSTEEPISSSASATDATADEAVQPPEGPAGPEENTATISVEFVDFGFEPIEGLKYKLIAGEKTIRGATSATCNSATLSDLEPGSEIEIFVLREHTKDFKNIGSVYAYPGRSSYSIVSPKIKFEVETEVHPGSPGEAEKNVPPVPPKLPDAKQDAGASSSANASSKTDASKAAPAPSSVQSKSPAAQSSSQAAAKSPSPQRESEKIVPGRDAKGNPQATVQDSTVDWLKRKILSVFNFWSWQDFQAPSPRPSNTGPFGKATTSSSASKKEGIQVTKKSAPVAAVQSVQGHPKVNPLLPPAVITPGRKLDDSDLDRLKALIDFVENQVNLNYSPYRTSGGTTANVLKEYARAETPSFGTKDPQSSLGLCQPYVKVALFKAGYTNGPGWEQQAKFSGRDWLKYGFTEVGNTLPQVEITYENAMAPADWPKAATCIRKRAELKKLVADRKKQKNPMTAEEIAAVEKNIPAIPDKQVIKYTQPDLMYTLPGDVIVYEQVDPAADDPAGHVDIRTYHGFMSDFAWPLIPSLGGPSKSTNRYRVTGVFRKISDTMATARVNAFLRILREHEAKGFKDPYHALRYDSSAKPPHITFTEFNSHPYAVENTNRPAGAYQIKLETWKMVTKKMIGWPTSFNPDMQDRIAIFLLQQRPYSRMPHPRRSALGYIMEGRVEDAVNKTSLWNEWSCLPGGGRESQMSMDRLKLLFDQYQQEYMK